MLGNTKRISYRDYVLALPCISGFLALSILYLISLMSMPKFRRWMYELFQLLHLLMYPFICSMMCLVDRDTMNVTCWILNTSM